MHSRIANDRLFGSVQRSLKAGSSVRRSGNAAFARLGLLDSILRRFVLWMSVHSRFKLSAAVIASIEEDGCAAQHDNPRPLPSQGCEHFCRVPGQSIP